MRRRAFLALLGVSLSRPLGAQQPASQPARKIGYLHPRTIALDSPTVRELRPVWNSLGYAEGVTVLLRSADDEVHRLPKLAAELVALGAGVIIAVGRAAVAAAAHSSAPVVALDLETDPIRSGLAASFARPGGNVTGLFLDQPSLVGKWLDLLREAAPAIQRVALVWDPNTSPDQRDAALRVAEATGVSSTVLEMSTPDGYEERFRGLARDRPTGVIQLGAPGWSVGAKRFTEAAIKYRLPTMTHQNFLAVDGALMSYGPARGYFGRVVVLANRILKGEKPSELPIEQPPHFEFVINLKTARALDLALPPTLLARADEVIE